MTKQNENKSSSKKWYLKKSFFFLRKNKYVDDENLISTDRLHRIIAFEPKA